MPRGIKICPNCKTETGPRAHYCTECGHRFSFAPKKFSPNKVVRGKFNWKELKKGEFIKSVSGHGPIYPTKDQDTNEIVLVPMGHYGIFKVGFVDETGIGAYEVRKGDVGGFCYIYMGKEKLSKGTGSIMRPHKLKRVIRRKK